MNSSATRDILLQTPYLEQAVAFYRDTLGLRLFLNTPDFAGLDAGGFRIFLERAGSLGPVMEFVAGDVPEMRRRLLDDGCTVIAEDPEMQRLILRDPFGLIFHLHADPHAAEAAEAEPIRDAEPPPHY